MTALWLAPLLVIMMIWAPFGFSLTGLIEEWDVLGLFIQHGLFFIADLHSPLAAHALRPLTIFPHAVAYFLDPDSFIAWHFLLIFALLIKGGASAMLIWQSTRHLALAALAGVLVLVYPADTMQLSFRALHINWALALALIASVFWLQALSSSTRRLRIGLALAGALLLFAAIMMYEAALMLLPLPWLMLWVRHGWRATWRLLAANKALLGIWLMTIISYGAYVAIISPQVPGNYQNSLAGGQDLIALLRSTLPQLFSVGLLRSLFGGWFDASRMLRVEFVRYEYLFLCASSFALAGLGIRRVCKRIAVGNPMIFPWAPWLRLAGAGLILAALGYAPFLLLHSHIAISQRTYLFATPGAAFFWLALLGMLWSVARPLAWLAGLLLISLGLAAQLFQFHHYVEISKRQVLLLRHIVENFDGRHDARKLLLQDGSQQLGSTWMLLPQGLLASLDYFYDRSLPAVYICHQPGGTWIQANAAFARMGRCLQTAQQWVLKPALPAHGPDYPSPPAQLDLVLPKDTVAELTIAPDSQIPTTLVLNEYRAHLQTDDTPWARRYRGVLQTRSSLWPWPLFRDQSSASAYRWEFGDWWSMEIPPRGSGWRDNEWSVDGLKTNSLAWKTQARSSLLFPLTPLPQPYLLQGRFDNILSDKIRQSIELRLNEHALAYRWLDANRFEAQVPAAFLKGGFNRIDFDAMPEADYFDLSARLDGFELHPQFDRSQGAKP